MNEHDPHSSFIKTPKQLVIVIVLSFVVPVIAILMLVELATSGPSSDPNVLNPEAVAARIQPVGRVQFGTPEEVVAQAAQPAAKPAPGGAVQTVAADGKAVYNQACMACHAQGVAGSPRTGDKAAWGPRLQQGMDALVQAALKGKGAMPPKGGFAQLTDAQVRAAVEFMVSQSK